MLRQRRASEPNHATNGAAVRDWRRLLALWIVLVVVLNGIPWMSGAVGQRLLHAVEEGAAEVEAWYSGEESEDVVRKAIRLQRDTLPFWTVIAAIRDFLLAPLLLALRALAVAVALSAVAAASGRPMRFSEALYGCVVWQGVWVLGLAVRVILMLTLHQTTASTSVLMFLSPEFYTARQWTLLQQCDCFALIGWLGMAWGARSRGQAGLLTAAGICFLLMVMEILICSSASLVVNLAMRMTLIPDEALYAG